MPPIFLRVYSLYHVICDLLALTCLRHTQLSKERKGISSIKSLANFNMAANEVSFSRRSNSEKVKLNLIMQQAISRIKKVNVFFSDLSSIASFISRSPERCSVLDKIVSRRLPRASSTRWNYNSRIINTVRELRCTTVPGYHELQPPEDILCEMVEHSHNYSYDNSWSWDIFLNFENN